MYNIQLATIIVLRPDKKRNESQLSHYKKHPFATLSNQSKLKHY